MSDTPTKPSEELLRDMLRRLREEQGIGYSELATRLNLSQSYVNDCFNGRRLLPLTRWQVMEFIRVFLLDEEDAQKICSLAVHAVLERYGW